MIRIVELSSHPGLCHKRAVPATHANASVATTVLAWYDKNAQALPWRAPPGSDAPDPYRVWLSEIMLQQTTVAAVQPYFHAFVARWPTVKALAEADDAAVMAAWAGLGYYARARNLLACARAVGGCFPDTEAALRALPGIGRYTAAAIAAIAFGRRAVVVDGNVERVVARLFAVDTPLPAAKSRLYALADSITPSPRAGDFAQAMMDLGRTICTPRAPRCTACPIRHDCRAELPELHPRKAARRARPQRHGIALWHVKDEHVWLVRRPFRGLLGGMRALPGGGWDGSPMPAQAHLLGMVTHGFTHFDLTLAVHESRCMAPGDGEWWPLATIADAGLPTVFMKAVRLAMQEKER